MSEHTKQDTFPPTTHSEHSKDDLASKASTAQDAAPPQKVSDEEFIKKLVNKAVKDTIKDEVYSHDATSVWTNKIVELLVRNFVQIDRENKYIGMLLSTFNQSLAIFLFPHF